MQPFYAQSVAGLSAFDLSKFSDEERQSASRLLDEATKDLKSGKLDDSVLKLIESYAIYPDPEVALAIGIVFDKKGEKKQAVQWYSDFLEETKNQQKWAKFVETVQERIQKLQSTNWILPVALGSAALLVVFGLMRKSNPSLARARS